MMNSDPEIVFTSDCVKTSDFPEMIDTYSDAFQNKRKHISACRYCQRFILKYIQETMISLEQNSSKVLRTVPEWRREEIVINYFNHDDKYCIIEGIGKGAFGDIYCAEYNNTEELVVLKRLWKVDIGNDIQSARLLQNELRFAINAGAHENLINFRGAFIAEIEDGFYLVLVSDYAPQGTLAGWLQKKPAQERHWFHLCEMLQGVLAGLGHLHRQKIYHLDIKPDNVVLQGKALLSPSAVDPDDPDLLAAQLIDFGISQAQKSYFEDHGNEVDAIAGTWAYMPPEVLQACVDKTLRRELRYSQRWDIYAVGVMAYEMFVGENPRAAVYKTTRAETDVKNVIREMEAVELDFSKIESSCISKVVEKCVSKHDKRYKNTSSAALDLYYAMYITQKDNMHESYFKDIKGVVSEIEILIYIMDKYYLKCKNRDIEYIADTVFPGAEIEDVKTIGDFLNQLLSDYEIALPISAEETYASGLVSKIKKSLLAVVNPGLPGAYERFNEYKKTIDDSDMDVQIFHQSRRPNDKKETYSNKPIKKENNYFYLKNVRIILGCLLLLFPVVLYLCGNKKRENSSWIGSTDLSTRSAMNLPVSVNIVDSNLGHIKRNIDSSVRDSDGQKINIDKEGFRSDRKNREIFNVINKKLISNPKSITNKIIMEDLKMLPDDPSGNYFRDRIKMKATKILIDNGKSGFLNLKGNILTKSKKRLIDSYVTKKEG